MVQNGVIPWYEPVKLDLGNIYGTFLLPLSLENSGKIFEIFSQKYFPKNLEDQNRTKNRTSFRTNIIRNTKGYLSSFRQTPGRRGQGRLRTRYVENLEINFVILVQGQRIGSLIDRS